MLCHGNLLKTRSSSNIKINNQETFHGHVFIKHDNKVLEQNKYTIFIFNFYNSEFDLE